MSGTSVHLRVEDPSAAGEARRLVSRLSAAVGLHENQAGAAALIATEAATNIVKHAGRGEVLLRELEGTDGVEILAVDRGPGMGNIDACLRDGYSTAGSSGTGLGAIQRLASVMDIYSRPGGGTVLLAQINKTSGTWPRRPFDIGAVSVPKAGEEVCGDGWAILEQRDRLTLMVVDGLGHGPVAAQAAREAERVFRTSPPAAPAEIITRLHGALRTTRGAAAAVAAVDGGAGEVQFVGVGNIAGMVRSNGDRRQTVSHNGTVGGEMRKVQEFTYPWSTGALLLMHSDGINTSWQLENYPGLANAHPSVIAAVLYRDANRGRDDATVVVVRQTGGS
jgi:anti-sigma regulatory factor (Ser/Thr protein kinase)